MEVPLVFDRGLSFCLGAVFANMQRRIDERPKEPSFRSTLLFINNAPWYPRKSFKLLLSPTPVAVVFDTTVSMPSQDSRFEAKKVGCV